ncbi:MAG: hypothetical protein JXQ87_07275 [Bacteroidia bacterium]
MRKLILVTIILIVNSSFLWASTIFVDKDASGNNDGTSWSDAFVHLQDALAVASSGDDIWIADGNYYPDLGSGITKDHRDESFTVPSGITLYGGFNGSETVLNQRDYSTNVVTLSGNIGNTNSHADNSKVILKLSNNAVIDGLSISKGNGTSGSGVYIEGATGGVSAEILNSKFNSNIVSGNGGAIYIEGKDFEVKVNISNCSFLQNQANNGGAIYANKVKHVSNNLTYGLSIENCFFSTNNASAKGGAMYLNESVYSIDQSSFSSNLASSNGGAIHLVGCNDRSNISRGKRYINLIFNSKFESNNGLNGGAISLEQSAANIPNNYALVGCSFRANNASSTSGKGGALYTTYGECNVINCSFGYNTAFKGGALYNSHTAANISNSVFGNNTSSDDTKHNHLFSEGNNTTDLSWCIVDGTLDHVPSINLFVVENTSPSFTSSSSLALQNSSLAINGITLPELGSDANPNYWAYFRNASTSVDADGNRRIVGEKIDLGAFENGTYTTPTTVSDNVTYSESFGPEFGVKEYQSYSWNIHSRQEDEKYGFAVYTSDNLQIYGSPGFNINNGGLQTGAGKILCYNESNRFSKQITAPFPHEGAGFGHAIDASSNYIAVGAPNDEYDGSTTSNYTDAGAVYLHETSSGFPYLQTIYTNDRANADGFGSAVHITNDYLIVGAPYEDDDENGNNSLSSSGSAYVYKQNSGSFNLIAKITSQNREVDGLFGYAVSIESNRLIIGAPGENSGKGRVYVFEVSGSTVSYSSTLAPAALSNNDEFGKSLAANNSVLLVGAPNTDGTYANEGVAYQFNWNSSSYALQESFTPNNPIPDGKFGQSVGVSSNFLAIGAPHPVTLNNTNYEARGYGRVYLYFDIDKNHSSFLYKTTLTDNGSKLGVDQFGWSLSLSAERLLIGEPYNYEPDIQSSFGWVPTSGDWDSYQKNDAGAAKLYFKNHHPGGACITKISDYSNNSFTVNFSSGIGNERLVVVTEGNGPYATPEDGISYNNSNSTFGTLSAKIGAASSNSYLVYKGTGNTVDVSGLTDDKKYHVRVFEVFDGSNGETADLYGGSTRAIKYAKAIDNEPTTAPTVVANQNVTWDANGKYDLNITIGDADKVIVFAANKINDEYFTPTPHDGQSYDASIEGDELTTCMLNELGITEPFANVVYVGSATTVELACAQSGTKLFIFGFNNQSGLPNYLNEPATFIVPESGTSCYNKPTTQCGSVTASRSCTGVDFTFGSTGDGTKRIVFLSTSSTPTLNSACMALSGTYAITTGSSLSFSGLKPNTKYYWKAAEADKQTNFGPCSGASGTEYNLLTTGAPSGDFTTKSVCTPAAQPTVHASNISANEIGAINATLTWTNGNGANRIMVLRQDLATQWTPADQEEVTVGRVAFLEEVKYNGDENELEITGLIPNTNYYVSIFEYNGGKDAQNYLTSSGYATYSFTTNAAKVWYGSNDEEWETNGNWLDNDPPTSTDNVLVDVGSNDPNVYDNISINSLNIAENANLTINSGKTLTLGGDLQNKGGGNFGEGTIVLSGSLQQKLRGNIEVSNLTVNNSNGVLLQPIDGNGTITINGDLNLSNGSLNIGDGTLIVNGTISGSGEIVGSANASIVIGGTSSGSVGSLTMSSTDRTLSSLSIDRADQDGNPGSIIIESDIVVDDFITLNNGFIEVDNSAITIGDGVAVTGGSSTSYIRLKNGGSLTQQTPVSGSVTIPIGRNPYLPVVIDNGGGTEFTVGITEKLYSDPTNTGSTEQTADAIGETWTISASSATTDVTVSVSWDEVSELDFDRANSIFMFWENGVSTQWDHNAASAATGSGPYSLSRTIDFTTNLFYVGVVSSGSPLPVKFTYFNAQWQKEGESTILYWQTAMEENNSHFEIERSFDGQEWEQVGTVNGQGTTFDITDYQFIDNGLPITKTNSPITIYYRLKQIDYNGQFEYSETKTLGFEPETLNSFNVWPNPAKGSCVNLSTIGDYEITTSEGVIVKRELQVNKIDISNLAEGVYLIRNSKGVSHRFIRIN